MGMNLPIKRQHIARDSAGRICKIEVLIEQHLDKRKYPPGGIKCVFKVLREKVMNEEEFELVLLIDNHEPYGFHLHNKLPNIHESRVVLHVLDWQKAWEVFDEKLKELLHES